jgi:hypothetical protein
MLSEKATDSNAVTDSNLLVDSNSLTETEPRSDANDETKDIDTIPTVCDNSISNGGKDVDVIKGKKSAKKKSVRCEVCRKKIGMLVFKCKCSSELTFCSSHVQPESHECLFDHKSDAIERLSSTLTKVVGDKIIRI